MADNSWNADAKGGIIHCGFHSGHHRRGHGCQVGRFIKPTISKHKRGWDGMSSPRHCIGRWSETETNGRRKRENGLDLALALAELGEGLDAIWTQAE